MSYIVSQSCGRFSGHRGSPVPSIETDHGAFDRYYCISLKVHVLRRFYTYSHLRFHYDAIGLHRQFSGGGFDRDIRFGLDRDSVFGAVDDDLVAPGLIDDFDGFTPGLIVKTQHVTAAGLDGAVVVFPVRVGLRRVVLPVPEATDYKRMIDLTMLEGHQD